MTPFHDRDPRQVDAWVTPDDDDLDDVLNTAAAFHRAPDAGPTTAASPRAMGALAFHRRLDEAQERDPAAAQPDPDLWDRILPDAGSHRKDDTMSSTSLASQVFLQSRVAEDLNAHPTTSGRQSMRSMSSLPSPAQRHSRLGRWANALAAVSLVLLLGVGYWFYGYGPGGSGGEEQGSQFAAFVLTPEASPARAGSGCPVEPLTTEEVMAIVRNPLNPLDAMGVTLAASPEPLLEVDRLPFTGLPESDVETTIPGEQDFAAMEAAARTYYDCLRFGSNSQMWAIIAPDVVQSLILQHFPVLRDEVTIEA